MTESLPRRARRLGAENGGAAAVEFAFISGAFIAFIMGICYISIMYFNRQSLDWAVQLAARQAEINSSVTQTQLRTTINDYLASVGLPAATVTYSVATPNGGVKTASIGATFRQTYDVPFVSTFHMTFSSNEAVPQL
jgi:Flp pilus assembly protein TadG